MGKIGAVAIVDYITHIYSGEKYKCSALVTRNNKIRLLEHKIMTKLLVSVISREN